MSIRDLVDVLQKIDSIAETPYGEPHTVTHSFNSDHITEGTDLVIRATTLALTLLINSDGGCNWDNIHQLEKTSYRIEALEKDSWGWLAAGIFTSKGVLIYG